MKLSVRSPRDFAAGFIFFTIGVLWMTAATHYRIGKATAMGPGYFPLAVAAILAVLGASSVVRSLRFVDQEPFGRWPIAALIFVLGGIVAFALLLESAGLIAASGAVVLLCCWSRLRYPADRGGHSDGGSRRARLGHLCLRPRPAGRTIRLAIARWKSSII